MNKSYVERENSDADSSVVEFLFGKSHVAVKSALMAAVIRESSLIANNVAGRKWARKNAGSFSAAQVFSIC